MTASPDPPLNCPKCGNPVQYQVTVRDVHVYNCSTDGRMCLRSDGSFGPAEGVERFFQTYVVEEEAYVRALEELGRPGDET